MVTTPSNSTPTLGTPAEDVLTKGEEIADEAMVAVTLITRMRREAMVLSEHFDTLLAQASRSARAGRREHLIALLTGRPMPEERSIEFLIEADETLHAIEDQTVELTATHRALSERLIVLSEHLGHLHFSIPLSSQESRESDYWRRLRALEASWGRISNTRREIEEDSGRLPLLEGSYDRSRWRGRMRRTYRVLCEKAYLPLETLPRFEDLRQRGIAFA